MILTNLFSDVYPLKEYTHTYVGRDNIIRQETEVVVMEHEIKLYINHAFITSIICLPMLLTEVVLGRLLTDGWICSMDDIASLSISQDGRTADVLLHSASISRPDTQALAESSVLTPIPWEVSWIFDLADSFSNGMPFHSKTFATHSCFLSMDGNILFSCEDIGRHNALDKTIGYALYNQLPLKKCILYSSGRVPLEIVRKVIIAGIPVFASKAAPTAQAVELARKADLTLLCAARKDRFKQYHITCDTHRAKTGPTSK